MAQMASQGKQPEILFWVGCAGSFDQRAQKITRDICKILQHVGISFAVLGTEESCTGDPAKRAGNEFLFQMQAMVNIGVLNGYEIKKIVTGCPHCFNTIKNEYPGLGGNYDVIHHTQLIQQLIDDGKLKAEGGESFKGKRITYHDPCYLGRGNNVYEAPRKVLEVLDTELVELKRCKSNGLCCGAGGAQMFKEPEPGTKDIYIERVEEIAASKANIVAAGCPFCMTMLTDGVKHTEQKIEVLDIAEITVRANGL
ncbi:(Fe-S)-binding protein [Mucilaginibacter puniceus]